MNMLAQGFGEVIVGHTAIDHAKLLGVRTPRKVVDRALLVERDAAVEVAGGAEEIQHRLAVVALVRLVDVRVRKQQDLRAKVVPLDLAAIRLEEVLLTRRRRGRQRE